MKPDLEPPRPPGPQASFVAFERADARFDAHWHYHPEFELTYIVDSQGSRLVGDHMARYRAGDLVFLGANLPHTWASEGPARARRHRAIVVQFRAEVIPSSLRDLSEFQAIAGLLARAHRGLHFSAGATPAIARALRRLLSLRGLPAWLALLRILARLAAAPARPLASLRFTPDLPLTQQARLQRALAYVDAHFDSDLALGSVARAAGVSPATLARLFRRMLGRSVVAYVTELRIGRVCRQLMDTERGVAEIAYACGFDNLANFNRRFRTLKGTTPTAFRRRYNR